MRGEGDGGLSCGRAQPAAIPASERRWWLQGVGSLDAENEVDRAGSSLLSLSRLFTFN